LLRKAHPLVLVGGPGWDSQEVHQQIHRGSEEGWLVYLGYLAQQQLPLVFSGARLFIFPTWYEGFGLPVLQAMASGVPCVTSSTSTLPEVCEGAALLVDPANNEAITEAIEKGLTDEPWRQNAIALGLASARKKTWDLCVQKTVEVYRQLAEI
jgi:alpha-1,3-rhamnosyl/mannosyltransferase